MRGGALPKKNKSRTGSLTGKKTATGKRKVQTAKEEKKSIVSDGFQVYRKILPLTRLYITAVATVTLLGLILGEELAQGLLAFDPIRVTRGFEFWRPFTGALFLGPPSVGWVTSFYFLFEYGSQLENSSGSAQHLVFLLSQIAVLSIFSALTGQPFFTQSVITSMLYVLSLSMPHQKVKWVVFTVPYWTLPYLLGLLDVLQAQSPLAILPHICGILSGHFYRFHKTIWPGVGNGEDWLEAPDWLKQKMDPDAKSNKDSVSKALKARNKKKGRKLGS
jgi:membrane associated rhomboid family serine protease